MYLHLNFVKIRPAVFEIQRSQDFYNKFLKLLQIKILNL